MRCTGPLAMESPPPGIGIGGSRCVELLLERDGKEHQRITAGATRGWRWHHLGTQLRYHPFGDRGSLRCSIDIEGVERKVAGLQAVAVASGTVACDHGIKSVIIDRRTQ